MPDYNAANFDPPAPVAVVTVRAYKGAAKSERVLMLLDTGSDISVLPKKAADLLGIEHSPNPRYILEAFDGTTSYATIAQGAVDFEGNTYEGNYVITNQEVGILGRNILNSVPILFNGPQQIWRIANHS